MNTERCQRCATAARPKPAHGDEGATLILALIFLVAVSLVVVGLVRWAGNDLANTSNFTGAQSNQSAANSANQFAIQFVQYNFLQAGLDSSTPASCWTTGSGAVSATTINNQTVDSWCMTRWYPGVSTSKRVVTISTCLSNVSAVNCGFQPLLQSIVTIVDGGSACYPVPNAIATPNTCGKKATISDWQFGATPPANISATASGSFSCPTGTSQVTVTGTNLTLATDVDFLEVGTAGSPSPVMAPGTLATGATTFNSGATIQACSPAALPGNSFYVIVSTPLGSNEYAGETPVTA